MLAQGHTIIVNINLVSILGSSIQQADNQIFVLFCFWFFEIESYYIALASLFIEILLPLLCNC